jgi:Leucine-rich repeat (LRR) protein
MEKKLLYLIVIVLLGLVVYLIVGKSVITNDGLSNGDVVKPVPMDKSDNGDPVEKEYPGSQKPLGKTTDLSGQGLTEFPTSVLSKRDTVVLDLSNNQIRTIPSEIGELTKLEELYFQDNINNITGLPAEVGQLSNLEVLDLSNNGFTGLPYELGNLKSLKVLDLSGNNYSEQDLEVIKKGLPSGVKIIL